MDDLKNMSNEVIENTTEDEVIIPDVPEEEENADKKSTGKLGLALLGLGGLAVAGGVVAGVNKIKNVLAAKAEANPKPEKPAKVKKIRGEKLSLLEKITGYRYENPPAETDVPVEEEAE